MARGARHDHHQVDSCRKKSREPFRGHINGQTRAQIWLLSGDTHRAVVCMARPHAETPNRLYSRI